jgi:hypothetical protein
MLEENRGKALESSIWLLTNARWHEGKPKRKRRLGGPGQKLRLDILAGCKSPSGAGDQGD